MRRNHTLKKRNRGKTRLRLLKLQLPRGIRFSSPVRHFQSRFTLKRNVHH